MQAEAGVEVAALLAEVEADYPVYEVRANDKDLRAPLIALGSRVRLLEGYVRLGIDGNRSVRRKSRRSSRKRRRPRLKFR